MQVGIHRCQWLQDLSFFLLNIKNNCDLFKYPPVASMFHSDRQTDRHTERHCIAIGLNAVDQYWSA